MKRKRLWFQFGLALLLVFVVILSAALLGSRMQRKEVHNLRRLNARLIREIERLHERLGHHSDSSRYVRAELHTWRNSIEQLSIVDQSRAQRLQHETNPASQ